jgi:flagellar assembly protein FliH
MLQKIEPKVRRMEYRVAFAQAEPATLPQVEVAAGQGFDGKGQDDLTPLVERIQQLEDAAQEREEAFATRLEAQTSEAYERGRSEEESKSTALFRKTAQAVEESIHEFAASRDSYLAQVEQEVVRLALSIAARVLHRDAQMDPLLLSGAVRVALGQLSDTTEVRLRVPAAEHPLWSEMIHLMPNLPLRPQLIADEGMAAGECKLETHLGSVDLGVKAQLAEIERGFFDLLERREPSRRDDFHPSAKPQEG